MTSLWRALTRTRTRMVLALLGVVVVAGGAVGGYFGLRSSSKAPTELLTIDGLASFVKSHGKPVYWVGRGVGADYQVTTQPNGKVFLEYVPAGSQTAPAKANLSVGTYPFGDAFDATQKLFGKSGFKQVKTSAGEAAVYATVRPTNVFVAFAGVPYQIEVYAAQKGLAEKLVSRGRVVKIP